MERNICIISETSSHILTKIISDNFIMLGLAERINIYSDVNDEKTLLNTLYVLAGIKDVTVYYIFEDAKLSKMVKKYCNDCGINSFDIHHLAFSFFYQTFAKALKGHETKEIEDESLSKEFIDFALRTDDGKEIEAINAADIVIIGISRTAKTPLSMYLSNHGYRVTNVPLVPEVRLQDELFKISKEKVFALYMDPDRLVGIRKERLKSLGLPKDSVYASKERIEEELNYTKDVVEKIGCKAIDVSNLSIEETANVIINILKEV